MTTLIVPAAGLSTRFPGMRPKYALTNWDGQLMIQHAVDPLLNHQHFDRVIFATLERHDMDKTLKEIYPDSEQMVFHNPTQGPAHTVFGAMRALNVKGPVVVKDTDSWLTYGDGPIAGNMVATAMIDEFDIPRVAAKSFVKSNTHGFITDIVEKSVISNEVSVGCYSFEDAAEVGSRYRTPVGKDEVFLSHVILDMILNGISFKTYPVADYVDVGTAEEWKKIQDDHATYFVDIDGTLVVNQSKYFANKWTNNPPLIQENFDRIVQLQAAGACIVLTTARDETDHAPGDALMDYFVEQGLERCTILYGLPHTKRGLVNDFSPSNPYPSASAINVRRDQPDLGDMI